MVQPYQFIPEQIQAEISGDKIPIWGFKGDNWWEALKDSDGKYNFEFDTDLLHQYVKPDSICLDIGAHLGVLTIALAKMVPKGRVYGFEGSSVSSELCSRNVAPFKNISFRQAIIGKGDNVTWHDLPGVLSSSHYEEGGASRTLSIDRLALDRVDFIKIDVEGAELDVLEGAKETLKRCKPVVLLEFNTYALVHYRNILPRVALKKIRELFSEIVVYDKRANNRYKLENDEAFLQSQFFNGLVDDLFCKV